MPFAVSVNLQIRRSDTMSNKQIRIFIACGSGIATSTVAEEEVKEICREAGIKAEYIKGTLSQIPTMQDDVDLILVTARYRKPTGKPVINVLGLLSGIGAEKIAEDIIQACETIMQE